MLILGLNKTTLLDYPERVAATIFIGGCNFRCPFCHNGGLVLEPSAQEAYSEEEVLAFLKKRKNILKGVCITGGEPTLQADLPEFIYRIKELGYQVKLDTNGYAPKVFQRLLDEKLLDYVAMDIKNSPEKYPDTVGLCDAGDILHSGSVSDRFDIDRIEESVSILKQAEIDYEFRTTVVKELHTCEDILKIAEWINGCPHYFLQQFKESDRMICEGYHGYGRAEMEELLYVAQTVPEMKGKVSLRGMD